MIRKLKLLLISEEDVRISLLPLNLFFLKKVFYFCWDGMVNKMCGSCPTVGRTLKVVQETSKEEEKQAGLENRVCSPLIRVAILSCS